MFCVINFSEIAIYEELSIFECMSLVIELPHVLENFDLSSIRGRSKVLQCGLSGTIVFSN